MNSLSFFRLVPRLALMLACTAGISGASNAKNETSELNQLLQLKLKSKFQKKSIGEIYLAGPQKTYNICGTTS